DRDIQPAAGQLAIAAAEPDEAFFRFGLHVKRDRWWPLANFAVQSPALEERIELRFLKAGRRAAAFLFAGLHVAGGRFYFRLRFGAFKDDDVSRHNRGGENGLFFHKVKGGFSPAVLGGAGTFLFLILFLIFFVIQSEDGANRNPAVAAALLVSLDG